MAVQVSWRGLVCALASILGVILFLVGANYYNALVGWLGVCLVVGGVLVYIALRLRVYLARRRADQKS